MKISVIPIYMYVPVATLSIYRATKKWDMAIINVREK